MKPSRKTPSDTDDLFRSRLGNIINMRHELARLADRIEWTFFEDAFDAFYSEEGCPGIPIRMMVGLHILKHMFDLSDENLCDRWVENPYFQYFCGEEYFQHKLTIDRSSMTRWRDRIGPEGCEKVFQESLGVARRTGALRAKDLKRVTVDTTVQEKAITFPTDAKLMHKARDRLVRLARKHGVELRQSYRRVGKRALVMQGRYRHAKQHKRANKAMRKLRTYLGRTIRDFERKTGDDERLREIFRESLWLAKRVLTQKRGVTPTIKKELRRRSAIEPVIGHMKNDGRLGRNFLKGRDGDRINALLAGAGYNYRLVLKWLRVLYAWVRARITAPFHIVTPLQSVPA